MQNIRLTLQYDGTRYNGWQKPEKTAQKNCRGTVSEKILSSLRRLTGESNVLFAGARTEPGVHALEQTINFQTESTLDAGSFKNLLNETMPMDISVLSADSVHARFRADLNARSRTYRYRICTAPVYDLFSAPFTAHLHPSPDPFLMQQGAVRLLGKHDFRNFCGTRKKKGTEKELLALSISASTPGLLTIDLTADDFLYRMPSLIIGTLIEIGHGARTPDCIEKIFSGTEKAGSPCESKGLLLKSIQY